MKSIMHIYDFIKHVNNLQIEQLTLFSIFFMFSYASFAFFILSDDCSLDVTLSIGVVTSGLRGP